MLLFGLRILFGSCTFFYLDITPDLNPVSDLIVASFYDKSTEDVWKHMFRLAELNRLQKNFPFSDVERHRMLVATSMSSATKDIVGFVDVDGRPATPNMDYT